RGRGATRGGGGANPLTPYPSPPRGGGRMNRAVQGGTSMRLFRGLVTRLSDALNGNGRPLRTLLARGLEALRQPPPASPLRATLEVLRPPATFDRAGRAALAVRARNDGPETWPARGPYRVQLAYRWLDHRQATVVCEGDRLPLPRAVAPGREV